LAAGTPPGAVKPRFSAGTNQETLSTRSSLLGNDQIPAHPDVSAHLSLWALILGKLKNNPDASHYFSLFDL
jgi:hypothetical protein